MISPVYFHLHEQGNWLFSSFPICHLFDVISFELILRNTGMETVALGSEATYFGTMTHTVDNNMLCAFGFCKEL